MTTNGPLNDKTKRRDNLLISLFDHPHQNGVMTSTGVNTELEIGNESKVADRGEHTLVTSKQTVKK